MSNCVKDTQLLDFPTFKSVTAIVIYPSVPKCSFEKRVISILRARLHGVGDPGLVGLVSFVFTLWGTQNKRNLLH